MQHRRIPPAAVAAAAIAYSISVAAQRRRWEARLSHAGFGVVVPCADVSPSKCRDGAGPLSEAGVGLGVQF